MHAQDTELRKELHCTIYPTNSLQKLKYVVICSYCNGKWLLSKHKKRSTWETQGGHIENGESALDAAKRAGFGSAVALLLDRQAARFHEPRVGARFNLAL